MKKFYWIIYICISISILREHSIWETLYENTCSGRRVRRGRPRLGTRGGKHGSPSVQGNSPSRSEWLPLDMRTTPPAAMPAFRGFEESSSDGVVNFHCSYIFFSSFISFKLASLLTQSLPSFLYDRSNFIWSMQINKINQWYGIRPQ